MNDRKARTMVSITRAKIKTTDEVSALTSDLSAEVKLHDVTVLQHGVVAHVGGVVRRHVVDRAARGERNAGLQVREQEEEGRIRRTIIKGKCTAEHNKMITHREIRTSRPFSLTSLRFISSSSSHMSTSLTPGLMVFCMWWRTCLCTSAALRIF